MAMAIRKPAPVLPPSEPLTADDFYALPDTPERYELYDGMLLMAPPPDSTHQDVALELATALRLFAREAGGRAFIAPIGVQLGHDTVFEPDVIYLAPGQERMVERRGIRGAPALIIEVASPSTRRYDTHTKLPTYFEHGVLEVWIVDPETRTVTVHTRGGPASPVAFGEPIESTVVSLGSAGLERLAPPPPR
jgi:Uma2 family endonuclease